MFSYRHAFHAGNHADVLKHTVLIAALQYLTEKDAALTVLDTHAGAGLYRLDGDYARTSGEAREGILRLTAADTPGEALAPMLQNYVDLVRAFNQGSSTKVYPGSPFIIQRLLRAHDKLKLFELHPTDLRALAGNVAQLDAGGHEKRVPSCGSRRSGTSAGHRQPEPRRRVQRVRARVVGHRPCGVEPSGLRGHGENLDA